MISASRMILIAEQAIRSNYPSRNMRCVSGNLVREIRIAKARRQQIREWIAVLRVARDPAHSLDVPRVTDLGPLPAHALRQCVLSLS